MSDFKAKCTKFDFRRGSAPQPAGGGACSAPPDLLAVFKGAASKGREGVGEDGGKKKRGEEKGKGGKKRGKVRGQAPAKYFGLEPPLASRRVSQTPPEVGRYNQRLSDRQTASSYSHAHAMP